MTMLEKLKSEGITTFYHFTDRDNLQSIVDNGGLYSWDYCERNNIQISKPGGDLTSRDLDRRNGHQNYVRVSFTRNHPMMYVAQKDGRITNPVILEIALDVVARPGTLFSDKNAVKSDAQIGATYNDLCRIHFATVKRRTHFDVADDERDFFQAEVLVKEHIPLEMITNISAFGIVVPKPKPQVVKSLPQLKVPMIKPVQATAKKQESAIQLHTPYTAQISREKPTAFIFLVDHSGSMRNTTTLYGQDMTCAAAVAQILNAQIKELVNRCIKVNETRHYYDIAVLGYGREVYSAWSGNLTGRYFVSPEELRNNPYKVAEVTKQVFIRGNYQTRKYSEEQWFEARMDGGSTYVHKAFEKAKALAEQWIKEHDANCYPPTIIHITDGEFNGSSADVRVQLANEIKSLYTMDGNVLLFNIHITPANMESTAFPAGKRELNGNRYAEELFDLSSLLPKVYNERIAQLQNIPMDTRLSAMAVNADMQQLIKIMDIGTPTNIRQNV
ncbi:MAG: DarT ssDNA thymidine ADP-ribosyltransferase family protein [Paludibacteraceae bacterium]